MRNRTVLLVDDSASALAHTRANLEFEGLEVLEARDGDEALDLANVHLPALVIVSLGAPGLDGYDLCRALADSEVTRGTRVVLTYGSMDVFDAARASKAGSAASLARPFLPRQLLATIQQVMGRGFLIPPGASMEIDTGADGIPETEVFLTTAESRFLEDTQDDTFTLSTDLIVDAEDLLGDEPSGGHVELLDRTATGQRPAIPLGRRALQVLVERAVQAHLERVLPDLVEGRVDEILARRER